MRSSAATVPITNRAREGRGASAALSRHWPEYAMEGAELGLFMLSACAFTLLLEHPDSPVRQALDSAWLRRLWMGLAMGATAVAIIRSPWGQRSGAHFNPSVTLTFLILGKIEPWDALFYILFQFAGGALGVLLPALLIGAPLGHAAVNYAATLPGEGGAAVAFAAELMISAGMMAAVLITSNARRLARLTPLVAGALLAVYITVEAPLSGVSLNPARTLASALPARVWTALWVYFIAPPLGMLAAAQLYRWFSGAREVHCAKLHHHNHQRCIFRCRYAALISGAKS